MSGFFKRFDFSKSRAIKAFVILYAAAAFAAMLQAWFSPPKTYFEGGKQYTEYNNYVIFKQSSLHLFHGQDLYKQYPEEQWDLYKYSPSFALAFTPFALLPDWLGLLLWDELNALILVIALLLLPGIKPKERLLILSIIFIEMLTSLQNEQSNGLLAGLVVLVYLFAQKKQMLLSTLMLAIAVYIKIYGVLAAVLFLFYPEKLKTAGYTSFWMIILFLLPLPVTGWHHLQTLYQNWWQMLSADVGNSYGLSVAGWLHSWFGLNINKYAVIFAGVVFSAIPFFQTGNYSRHRFRILALSLVLVWMVIFNPKAESPTFVIAMTGAALWFAVSPKNRWNAGLIVLAIIFTSLSPTDLFPPSWRTKIFIPYSVKVVPCILIWIKIVADMIFFPEKKITP